MSGVARKNQRTVSRSAVTIRMEGIRTDLRETKYTPLERY